MLEERRAQLAGSLSGGEQQMCAIGRALMARPRVLMLDEPTLGLAPVLVARIFETVRTINADGVTVLLVEQNVRQALTLADRACVLESGRLVLTGPAPSSSATTASSAPTWDSSAKRAAPTAPARRPIPLAHQDP